MKRTLAAAAALAALVAAGAPGVAADRIVKLTIDGRPVDRATGVAVQRNGTIFADVVDLTKAFDGLLTFQGRTVHISIRGHEGTFAAGRRSATIDTAAVTLPGTPFVRNGDLFVPLLPFIKQVAQAGVAVSPDGSRADVRVAVAEDSGK